MIDRPRIRAWPGKTREEQIEINRAWIGAYLRYRARFRRDMRKLRRPVPAEVDAGRRMHRAYSRRLRARRRRE